MSKNIVILGCPRSGTSLVAQLVKSAGFDADGNGTKQLMKPNPKYNPEGYFERLDIVRLNDNLLNEMDSAYNFLNPPSISNMVEFSTSKTELTKISHELNSYNNWFIKDSRLCFTLHLYNLDNISIIKVKRNPKDVKPSMVNHYGDLFNKDVIQGPHKVSKIIFEQYYQHVDMCIDWQRKNIPSTVINYEDVISGDIDKLNEFLDKEVDSSLINPKYRNYGV